MPSRRLPLLGVLLLACGCGPRGSDTRVVTDAPGEPAPDSSVRIEQRESPRCESGAAWDGERCVEPLIAPATVCTHMAEVARGELGEQATEADLRSMHEECVIEAKKQLAEDEERYRFVSGCFMAARNMERMVRCDEEADARGGSCPPGSSWDGLACVAGVIPPEEVCKHVLAISRQELGDELRTEEYGPLMDECLENAREELTKSAAEYRRVSRCIRAAPNMETMIACEDTAPARGTPGGARATEGDCRRLGEKTVELTETEIGMELEEQLARDTAKQVYDECMAKDVLQSEVDCIMRAKTLSDLDRC